MKKSKIALVAIPLAFALGWGVSTLLAPRAGNDAGAGDSTERGTGTKTAKNGRSKPVTDVPLGRIQLTVGSRALGGVPAGTRVRIAPASDKNANVVRLLNEWADANADGAGAAFQADGVEIPADGKLELPAPIVPPLKLVVWSGSNAFPKGERKVGTVEEKRNTPIAIDLAQLDPSADAMPAPAESAMASSAGASAPMPAPERMQPAAPDPNRTADFCALVVTGNDTPTPVVGAKARADGETLATSDALGRLALKYEPGVTPLVRVTGPGLGPTFVQVRPGHETAETAVIVNLRPSASIASRILGPDDRPVRGVSVEVSCDLAALVGEEAGFAPDRSDVPGTLGPVTWKASSNELGAVYVDGLPAEVALTIRATRGVSRSPSGEPAAVEGIPDRVKLAPGERWSGDWRIPSRPDLAGRVVDQTDEPVVGVPIWLVRAEPNAVAGSRYLRREDRPAATCDTDAMGGFHFDGVEPGLWLVGVGLQAGGSPTPWQLELDHLAQAVEIAPLGGPAPPELLLRVGRGFSLRGVVLQADGAPAAGMLVTALEDGGRGVADARTAQDGTFAIAPVSKGSYRLVVAGAQGTIQHFGPIAAGSRELVLRIAPAKSFLGRVVSAEDLPRAAAIAVFQDGAQRAKLETREPVQPGVFEAVGLEPGRYDFVATTEDGQVGIARDVAVGRDQAEGALRIRLERGGLLTLRWDGARSWRPFALFVDERPIALGLLQRAVPRAQFVPAGRITVRLFGSPDAEAVERTVEVSAGGQAELVIGAGAGGGPEPSATEMQTAGERDGAG